MWSTVDCHRFIPSDASDGDQVILYCNSGRSATMAYVGCRVLGMDGLGVYDGSMAEWSSDAGAEVER